MKKSFNKYSIINIGFYGGLTIKSIDALIEFIGGFMLINLSHNMLNNLIHLIALPELIEDPKDVVMNYFIKFGQNFSISSQHSVAIYMLMHGAVKLIVIWLLIKKKLWAYPLAAVVFGLFIIYEIYSLLHNLSILLLLLIIVDATMIVMIILEHKRLKMKK
jgi:uncharacterized membrane protein